MKSAFRIIHVLLFLLSIYAIWAHEKWEPLDNQTGIMENCRWKTSQGIKVFDCLIRLSNGELANVQSFMLDDESHKYVTLKVEANKLLRKRKRYTFISSG